MVVLLKCSSCRVLCTCCHDQFVAMHAHRLEQLLVDCMHTHRLHGRSAWPTRHHVSHSLTTRRQQWMQPRRRDGYVRGGGRGALGCRGQHELRLILANREPPAEYLQRVPRYSQPCSCRQQLRTRGTHAAWPPCFLPSHVQAAAQQRKAAAERKKANKAKSEVVQKVSNSANCTVLYLPPLTHPLTNGPTSP
jgi:hypothetical protein